jgi:broad specificity phosphatase PhoE
MGTIYLVRHGQASFGSEDYDCLSETGVLQARYLGAALKARLPRLDAVVYGSMRRQRQTADICSEMLGFADPAGRDPGWDEYDHQDLLHGLEPRYRERSALAQDLADSDDPWRRFQRLFSQAVARWTDGEHDADYKESWPSFRSRVEAALERLRQLICPAKTALVVTSGGPIAVVCQKLLGLSNASTIQVTWGLANAALTKLTCTERGLRLSSLNEHGYLEEAGESLVTYR